MGNFFDILAHFLKALGRILTSFRLFVYFLISTSLLVIVVAYINNLELVHSFLSSGIFNVSQKAALLLNLTGGLFIESGLVAGVVVALLLALVGIEIALIIEYAQAIRTLIKGSVGKLNIFSVLTALFTFGCVACGSILSLLPVVASFSGAILLLPLKGIEFSMLGICSLIISVGLLEKRIRQFAN